MARAMALAAAAAAAVAVSASAGQLVIELDREYSVAAWPHGDGPWARATFTDKPGGVVGLVLECLLEDSGEFMAKANGTAGWAFNLDPALNPDDLSFTNVGTGTDRTASAILTHTNTYKAGPDKWYDLSFQFGQTGLGGGDVAEYDIVLAGGGLSALSFDFVSANGPANKTGFHSAVHVQGISNPSEGQGSSGWMGGGASMASIVPLPSAGMLAMAGMGAVASRRRRAM